MQRFGKALDVPGEGSSAKILLLHNYDFGDNPRKSYDPEDSARSVQDRYVFSLFENGQPKEPQTEVKIGNDSGEATKVLRHLHNCVGYPPVMDNGEASVYSELAVIHPFYERLTGILDEFCRDLSLGCEALKGEKFNLYKFNILQFNERAPPETYSETRRSLLPLRVGKFHPGELSEEDAAAVFGKANGIARTHFPDMVRSYLSGMKGNPVPPEDVVERVRLFSHFGLLKAIAKSMGDEETVDMIEDTEAWYLSRIK